MLFMKHLKKLKKTERFHGLMLVKGESERLPGKNLLPFHGLPMFVVNLKKCLRIFDKTYVSTDSPKIAIIARRYKAIPILRGKKLCGDTPNIPVYKHAIKRMSRCDGIVAVQANSPTIKQSIIEDVKILMEKDYDEIMTCDENYKIYGSVWGITIKRLKKYGDPYKPKPGILIKDLSKDIHLLTDYQEALMYNEKHAQ